MNLTRSTTRRLALLWTLGIVVACSIPSTDLPVSSTFSFADKLVHVLMFAGFGVLWMRASRGSMADRMRHVGAGGVCFAAATEVYQKLAPLGRAAEWLDVLADAVGLALAFACYAAYLHFSPPSRTPR